MLFESSVWNQVYEWAWRWGLPALVGLYTIFRFGRARMPRRQLSEVLWHVLRLMQDPERWTSDRDGQVCLCCPVDGPPSEPRKFLYLVESFDGAHRPATLWP
jgi:hypothetical protein